MNLESAPELLAALLRYGNHTTYCSYVRPKYERECDCGWHDILVQVDPVYARACGGSARFGSGQE
jgi:hypothetical protein